MSPGSTRTMTSAPRRSSTSAAASSGPSYRVTIRSAVSDTPSSIKRAWPPDLDRAQRRVRLGHQDGRPGVAPQMPGLDVLLLDPDVETAIAPLVVNRGQQHVPSVR